MGSRAFKTELYSQFARIGKALSSPHRIEILDLLAQAPRTVESRKDGLYVEYSLADEGVAELLQAMRGVAERRLAEIDRLVKAYLGGREALESIGFDELAARVEAGSVILLD